jgi:hypothetical protein
VTQQYFPAAGKEAAALVPGFKTGNHAAVNNCRPISVLNNFSRLFEFMFTITVSLLGALMLPMWCLFVM